MKNETVRVKIYAGDAEPFFVPAEVLRDQRGGVTVRLLEPLITPPDTRAMLYAELPDLQLKDSTATISFTVR